MVFPTAPLKSTVPTADDAFHILRDCRTLYLKELGELLQEAERVPNSAMQAFQQTVGEYFDEMTSPSRRSGFDVANGLTASRISLVGESDLELEIRLGNFSARLMETTGGDLWRVYLRFVTLLRRPDLSTADNPVGPKGIALGLMDFCAQLEEDHDRKMARVDQLESYFSKRLAVLYNTLNDFLATRHVDMAQPSIITTPDATPTAPANPAAALHNKLLATTASESTAAASLSPAMLSNLLSRLDQLEKSGQLAPPSTPIFSNTASHPSLEALIPGLFADREPPEPVNPSALLRPSELGVAAGSPEAATINAISLTFENLLASPTLGEAIKNTMAGLRIPLLKAALLDPGFFSSPQHLARLLLDKIAQVALGLPSDIPPSHPVCRRIQAIVDRIRDEFRNDLAVFEQQIKELNLLIAERDRQITHSAEAYLPLLQEAERRKQAHRRSRLVIEQHLAHGAPPEIATFLRTYWLQVLESIWLESGELSAPWREHNTLVKDLLWSIQPKSDLEERKQLARMLQPMLQHLNAGMARISVPEAAQAAFLDTCFALQTAAMRGSAAAPPVARTPPPPAGGEPESSEIVSGKLRLKVIDLASTSPPPPPPAQAGSWLQLSLPDLPDDPPLFGCLNPYRPDGTLMLISNPDWDFALAIHPEILERMFADKTARICSTNSLFDAAAGQALQETARL